MCLHGWRSTTAREAPQLVVLVDQFEELFTYRPLDAMARERFERDCAAYLANLLNAAAAPGGRITVVITMRSDFLSTCATLPQLSAVLSAHQELVGPMSPAELREAIVQPAYLLGHEVEPALVERLLADVKGQTGALPLLQFALTEVWKKRDVRRLTLRAYEELGKDDQGRPRGIEGRSITAPMRFTAVSRLRSRTFAGGSSCDWCSRAKGPKTRSAGCRTGNSCRLTPKGRRPSGI